MKRLPLLLALSALSLAVSAAPVWASTAQATVALKQAIQNNDMAAFSQALSQGADVNAWDPKDSSDMTPLVAAAASGKLAMVQALLAHGAKVSVHSETDPAYVFTMPAGTNYFEPDHYATALNAAATIHNIPIMEALLKAGANINARDMAASSVFSAALMSDNSDMKVFRFLLDHGYNPGRERYNNSLIDAAFAGSPQLIRLLLAHGSRINGTQKTGMTALMSAACGQNGPVVDLLIKHGAVVNARDKTGTTALGFAMRGQRPVSTGPNDTRDQIRAQNYDEMIQALDKANAKT